MCITTTIHLGYVKCRQHAAHPGVGIDASVADEEVVTANRRRGVPTGVCVKQAMDGLRRRVRQGCLSSRGACPRSEEHTSELQSLMRISYAVFCLQKKHKTATDN